MLVQCYFGTLPDVPTNGACVAVQSPLWVKIDTWPPDGFLTAAQGPSDASLQAWMVFAILKILLIRSTIHC
jgi:hypothetical protein